MHSCCRLLQEMKRVFEEKKAEIGATLGKQAKEETENNAGKNKKAKGKAEEAAKPQFCNFLPSAISAE